jgi:hypothetical protein
MSSIVNFDRDLQYVGANDIDRTFTEFSIGTADPVVPVGAQPMSQFTSIKNGDFSPLSISGDSYVCRGVSLQSLENRQVVRLRGTCVAPEGTRVQLLLGWSETFGGSVVSSAPIETGIAGINFDETISAEGVTTDVTDPNWHVLWLAIINEDSQPAVGLVNFQMSVQDISVAPPEYEAARR